MHIIIIGAGPGISRSVARLFGSNGFKVSLLARNEEKLKSEATALQAEQIETTFAVADAGNEASLLTAIDIVEKQFGPADVVLYNAYAPVFKRIEAKSWESIQQQLNVNAGGAFYVLKKCLPAMLERNAGKLFFTGGGLAMQPQPSLIGLALGKAALRNLVAGAALGLRNKNVHIATLTICGFVNNKDEKYNPDSIAQEYWKLYGQEAGTYQTDVIY